MNRSSVPQPPAAAAPADPSSNAAPWSEVRRTLAGPAVAALVGLEPARERHKYACPRCDSSDACHVYDDGAYCYSCEWSGSVIDLAAAVWRMGPAEACRRLAELHGVQPDPIYRPPSSPSRRRESDPDPHPDVLRVRAGVYGRMVEVLELGLGGRAYLEGRKFSPDLAEVHGFRSLDTADAWAALVRALRAAHTPEELEAAGLWREGRPWLPWGGRVPALLIPYYGRTGRQVEAVRWRRMTPGERRYMAPIGAGARIPWGAEAVDAPRPLDPVVMEGELDALMGRQRYGYDSMALGGATPSRAVLEWLVEAVEDVDTLVLWTDADDAGDGAVDRLARMLARRYGSGWVRERVERWRSRKDPAETMGGPA